jgi:hypothetical protein
MTVEELLKEKLEEYHYEEDAIMVTTAFLDMFANEFAKIKVKEALEIAAKKAKIKYKDSEYGVFDRKAVVNKNSILNAVNLDEFIK